MSSLFTSRKFTSGTTSSWYILPIHRSEDENNEKISSSNENNSEVKTINQINQVDNTDKNDPDQDKFNDFGNYSEKYLKAIGVLVQVRTYKNPTELLLKKFDKTIQIKAGQKVCFYKFGPLIHLVTEGM